MYADRHRTHKVYSVGDSVMLSTKNITLTVPRQKHKPLRGGKRARQEDTSVVFELNPKKNPNRYKWLPRWIGPFPIVEKYSDVVYKLQLPPTLKIHNVFHISLLKPYQDGKRNQPPPPIYLGQDDWE